MPAPPPESDPAMMRIRAVDVTLLAFDPRFAAKFSMCTRSSLGRQIPRNGSRGRLDRLANVVDQAPNHFGILAFGHDPDQRLGTRLADEEAAPPFELGLGCSNAFPHTIGFERL